MMGLDVALSLFVVVHSWALTIVCASHQPLCSGRSVLRCLHSRRPVPAKSRVTSTGAAKGGLAHGTRAHLQPGQCLLCRQMGHLARDLAWDRPNRGMRDDSGTNLKRAFGSFVGMTGDASSLVFTRLVLTKTQQQEVERGSDFTMSHVPVAICLSLLVILERLSFHWLPWPARSKTKHSCSIGTQTEPEPAPPPSPARERTPRTVLITENGILGL